MALALVVEAAPASAEGSGADWRARAAAHLHRYMKFPPHAPRDADRRATVRFVLDRRGRVVRAGVESSSGSDIFDRAALACVRRASPFPRPIPVGRDGTLAVTVPLRFTGVAGSEN